MTLSRLVWTEHLNAAAPLMRGRALDIGGEPETARARFARPAIDWTYLNVSTEVHPTVVADGVALPFADESFDTVVMLETLEHVPQPDATLEEAVRVLKSDGRLFVSMPFLYRHHRDPADFQRWTHERFFACLEDTLGLRIEIFVPRGGWLLTVFDVFSQGLMDLKRGHFLGSGLLGWFSRGLYRILARTYPWWRKADRALSDADRSRSYLHRFTTGYFLVARKPGSGTVIPVTPEERRDVLRHPLPIDPILIRERLVAS